MSRIYPLPKSEILRASRSIEALFTTGKFISEWPVKIVYQISDSGDKPVQVLFTVPGRLFKKAVDRNRIRRKLKEIYRLNKKELIQVVHSKEIRIHLGIVYSGKDHKPDYQLLEAKLRKCLGRLQEVLSSP